MRVFSVWLAIVLSTFGLLAGAYHFYLAESPRRVLIVIDSSFSMKPVWQHVPSALEHICHQSYTEFALVTEKKRAHSWSSKCDFRDITPYAPRDFSKLKISESYPELNDATQIYLITNAAVSQTADFRGWQIVNPYPQ